MTTEPTPRRRALGMRLRRYLALALALVALGVLGVGVAGTAPATQAVLSGMLDRTATVAWASPAADDATVAAIQAVIQQANDAQQQAFAAHDPSAMQETSTSAYYEQMVQTNQDLAQGGVTAIKLLKLGWGPVTLTNAATATATTYETWQTTYATGATGVSRDQNVYTLVLDQGAWKIQADDHPDASASSQSGQAAPDPAGRAPTTPSGPVPPTSRVDPNSTAVSHNWSGYAANSGNFTAVTGTWTVPQSDGTLRFGGAATWVGVGGVSSRDLVQAGTQQTSLGNGSVQYQAWVETLPQASRRVPFTVSPDDSVTVSITETQTNQWLIAFKNNTTGATYQTTVNYSSSHSSAEWVQEAPFVGRGMLPLDNFGSVTFSGGSAVKDGQAQSIAQAGGKAITMIDSYTNALATPSAVTADGGGFTVTRSATSAASGQSGQPQNPLGGYQGNPYGRSRGNRAGSGWSFGW